MVEGAADMAGSSRRHGGPGDRALRRPSSISWRFSVSVFPATSAARQSIYPARQIHSAGVDRRAGGLADVLWRGGDVEPVDDHRLFRLVVVGNQRALDLAGPFDRGFLGWTQALTWMPYPLPGLRVIVTVFGCASLDGVILLAAHFQVSEQLDDRLPGAAAAARLPRRRGRRRPRPPRRDAGLGRTPSPGSDASRRPPRPRRAGESFLPARAQSWLSGGNMACSLPALVAILLPCELALLFVAE